MTGVSILILFGACFGLATANVPEIDPQLDRCLGKHGVFLPVIGSCDQYIICVEGRTIISSCGNYHFNARLSACDVPESAGCIISEPLPIEPVEKPSSEPFGSPCVGVTNGAFLPIAKYPRQYFLCMNNKAFLKDCGKLYFSAKHSACAASPDDDTPIKETIRPIKKVEKVEQPTQKLPGLYATFVESLPKEEEVKPPKKFENAVILPPQELPGQHATLIQQLCQNQEFGARVAVPNSCNQYYICLGNTGIPKSCGQMQFNPWTEACGLSTNIHCHVENGKIVYHTIEQQMGSSSQKFTSNRTNVCLGQRDGILLAISGKCSEFVFCFKDQAFPKTCGRRHFSPITLSCVEPEVSNCVESSKPVQAEQQSKFEQATVALEASCLSRDNGILLQHPLDCGKFVMCDNHVAVEMNCPGGLHFNIEKDYCDWPEFANCILNN